ncbi:MAG: esterase [Sphingobacteriaceae bacterium]|jgi:carboxylesterase|nr:esterase [Sphingobacteriaceae bacterium]
MKKIIFGFLVLLFFSGCGKNPELSADMLGGGKIFDPLTYQPEKYLLSVSKPTPTTIEAAKPVLIACHGYSASTFEWDEFRIWMDNRSDFYLSQVLLAGHGRTYEEFKASTWKDWQSSIADEYNKLVKAGYKKINFVASSTSCPLLLDMVNSGYFDNAPSTVNIMLIDPIIIPSDKTLSLVGIVGPMLGYIEADNTKEEDKYYYHYSPQETLQQLQNVLTTVRKELEHGITLSPKVSLKVYKSIQDPTADPVSAVLIYNGVKTSTGEKIDLQMVNSRLHVFTRLTLRPNVAETDWDNQTTAFEDIAARIKR